MQMAKAKHLRSKPINLPLLLHLTDFKHRVLVHTCSGQPPVYVTADYRVGLVLSVKDWSKERSFGT